MMDFDSLVQNFEQASLSPRTRAVYENGIKQFVLWGGTIPCTAKLLSTYLADIAATKKWATIQLRAAAIHYGHTQKGVDSPARSEQVKNVLKGIRRSIGSAQRRVKALMKDDLVAALTLAKQQQPRKAARDIALLLIAWCGAFRRSELVAIEVQHINWCSDGLEILLPRSKTDQAGEGRTVFIPKAHGALCPCKALKEWLDLAGVSTGAVFRGLTRYDSVKSKAICTHTVALLVKECVWRVKGADCVNYSGHSARAGFVTQAVVAGVPVSEIASVTGHKSQTVLAKYVRMCNQRRIPSLL
jgi:integrase